MRVIAADIGGTNARVALVEVRDGATRFLLEETYPSAGYAGFEEILAAFHAGAGGGVERACLAVAGVVVGDVCRTTNLPWVLEARSLERAAGIPRVSLVNDFKGAALGIPHLGPDQVVSLGGPDAPVPGSPPHIALLGAGTGLGEALLVWTGSGHVVVPTEGGHTDFAPRDDAEARLWAFLRARFGHVSYERVLSGSGLVGIYEHLRDELGPVPEVEAALAGGGDDAAAAVSAAAERAPTCDRALDLFCSVYGAEAGNLALKLLPAGGVYVAGGIAPKILPRLARGTFRAAFLDKGRYRALLETYPLRVVIEPRLGLIGAAHAAAASRTPG